MATVTTTFKKWLKRFESDDTPLGAFAKYVSTLEHFPDTTIRQQMLTHLQVSKADPSKIAWFKIAYDDYRIFRKREII